MSAYIEWGQAEWSPQTRVAYLNGIEGAIDRDDDGSYFWIVKPLSSRCEYPECWNARSAATWDEAREACEESMRRADASYRTRPGREW